MSNQYRREAIQHGNFQTVNMFLFFSFPSFLLSSRSRLFAIYFPLPRGVWRFNRLIFLGSVGAVSTRRSYSFFGLFSHQDAERKKGRKKGQERKKRRRRSGRCSWPVEDPRKDYLLHVLAAPTDPRSLRILKLRSTTIRKAGMYGFLQENHRF